LHAISAIVLRDYVQLKVDIGKLTAGFEGIGGCLAACNADWSKPNQYSKTIKKID